MPLPNVAAQSRRYTSSKILKFSLPVLPDRHQKVFSKKMLADFVQDCCIIDKNATVKATELYNRFVHWYRERYSNTEIPSQKMFGSVLKNHFRSAKSGIYAYVGIGLKDMSAEEFES